MDANRRIDRQLTQALAPGATPPLLSLAMHHAVFPGVRAFARGFAWPPPPTWDG